MAHLVPVPAHLLAGVTEETHQVGVSAEAAVPYADRLLSGQPRGDERVRDAIDDERGGRQRFGIGTGTEEVDAGDRGEPLPQ